LLINRVATATLIENMCCLPKNDVQKALRCQKAEHDFAGMPCGIMDQYISTMGQEGHLLLIDCRTTEFELVPFSTTEADPIILVTNSNVKHQLTGSEYPDRVRQCKEATAVLCQHFPHVESLRDADLHSLDAVKNEMTEISYRRAKHVISENIRTLSTVKALTEKDYVTAGQNMTASHVSLRDDYEVSCVELDYLVDIALSVPGVYGSRMTGGGFGGCTVTLVDRKALDVLTKVLKERYHAQFNVDCECYEAIPSSGAGVITLEEENIKSERNENKEVNKVEEVVVVNKRALTKLTKYIVPVAVIALSFLIGINYYMKKK
jgi:galactokinase